MDSFRRMINLVEGRSPDVKYLDDKGKVTATVGSYKSQSYTKLAKNLHRIQQLEAEVKRLKEEIQVSAKEDVADLFDADDEVKTRVIETVNFVLTLSKTPTPTITPKYKEILEKLSESLTPELITILEGLKTEMVSIKTRAPTLKAEPKTVRENADSGFSRIKMLITQWAASYDKKLDELKTLANGEIDNEIIAEDAKVIPSEEQIKEALISLGGKYWEKNGMRRIYFNSDALCNIIGLSIDQYKTGNISSARLNGEQISNTSAKKLLSSMNDSKIHFDLNKKHFAYSGGGGSNPENFIRDIRQKMHEIIGGNNQP